MSLEKKPTKSELTSMSLEELEASFPEIDTGELINMKMDVMDYDDVAETEKKASLGGAAQSQREFEDQISNLNNKSRTATDKVLASFLGIGLAFFVAIFTGGLVYELTDVYEKNENGYINKIFPPEGWIAVIVMALFAFSFRFGLLDLLKSLLTALGVLASGSGELLEKTALEAAVKVKEGKRKASEIAREADIRVGVGKEIKTEEDAYERAAEELEHETQNKGIWAKAFSDADGDEQKQKALYIKYRAEQLIKNIVQ